MQRIYLDHNATTPIHPDVWDVMLPYFMEQYGNPSTRYQLGRQSWRAIVTARRQVADMLNADPKEIIFTSSGTESINLALWGVLKAQPIHKRHVITTTIEHSAVGQTCRALGLAGYDITEVPVDSSGRVSADDIARSIRPDTALVSVMLANNETGVIQPIQEIAQKVAGHDCLFHTDAVQAVGKILVDVRKLGVDLLSFSGHKIYGPKGSGALFIKSGTAMTPILYGGGQESNLRGGTENVPAIAGLGKACRIIASGMDWKPIDRLRILLKNKIKDQLDRVLIHPDDETDVLPNTLNVSFLDVESTPLITHLDSAGIEVSAGAACSEGALKSSHVLLAMGVTSSVAQTAIRFSMGRDTTEDDISFTVETLKWMIPHLRAVGRPFS